MTITQNGPGIHPPPQRTLLDPYPDSAPISTEYHCMLGNPEVLTLCLPFSQGYLSAQARTMFVPTLSRSEEVKPQTPV